jgi:tetratricopeptide (TPR) repeat protein
MVVFRARAVKQTIRSIVFFFLVASVSPTAAEGRDDQWEVCRKTPVRTCVLDEAVDLVKLLDRTSRRSALLASIAEARAEAGDVASATALVLAIPLDDASRVSGLRAVAEAQARTGHLQEAAEEFDQALQLVYAVKDPLRRGMALHAIAKAQAHSGFAAAAEETYDQALQAAQTVRIAGESGRVTIPTPEQKLASLLKELAMHQAEIGQLAQALETTRGIHYDLLTRASTFLALADLALSTGARMDAVAILHEALEAAHREGYGGESWPSYEAAGFRLEHGGSNYVYGLCDIAKAQARAGLAAEAAQTFEEVAQAVNDDQTDLKPFGREWSATFDLTKIADAQREAGLVAVAQATLARAAALANAVPDRTMIEARVRVAESQMRAGLSAAASTIALVREEAGVLRQPHVLARIAAAEARAGLNDEAAGTFTEALAIARSADEGRRSRALLSIAEAQDEAGLVESAATTFAEALASPPHGPTETRSNDLFYMIGEIVHGGRGARVLAASPELRSRLMDAAHEIEDRLARAELLHAIAKALPD